MTDTPAPAEALSREQGWGSGFDAGMSRAESIVYTAVIRGETPETPPLGLLDVLDEITRLRTRAEEAEAEVKRLREGAARYLAVQLDFDGLDVQEVHAFTTPEERLAFLRQQANDPELGRPERATRRGVLWDYSGYRTALFPVDAPALAGSLS